MKRAPALLLLLLTALFLAGGLPAADPCADQECDCVRPVGAGHSPDPDGTCGAGCTLECCTSGTVVGTRTEVEGPPDDLVIPSLLPPLLAPPSAPLSEILHIPEAV